MLYIVYFKPLLLIYSVCFFSDFIWSIDNYFPFLSDPCLFPDGPFLAPFRNSYSFPGLTLTCFPVGSEVESVPASAHARIVAAHERLFAAVSPVRAVVRLCGETDGFTEKSIIVLLLTRPSLHPQSRPREKAPHLAQGSSRALLFVRACSPDGRRTCTTVNDVCSNTSLGK